MKNISYMPIVSSVSIASLVALLILGFNFNNYCMVGAIWTGLYASIYSQTKDKKALVFTIVSFAILAIGALGLFMN